MFKKKKNAQNSITEFDLSQEVSLTDEQDEITAPPKKKLPSWAIWPILGVLCAVGIGASVLAGGNKKETSNTLNVVEVKTGNIREIYNASGTIESENTKTYYSPVTAPISNCNAEIGKLVSSGDLLITFDTKNLERENQQAQLTLQSSYNSSQATREKNAQAIAQAQQAVNEANAALADQANALAANVNALGEQLAQAEAVYNASKERHDQPDNLQRIAELQSQIAGLQTQIADYEETINYVEVFYQGDRAEYNAAIDRANAGTPQPGDEKTIAAFDNYDEIKYTALPKAQTDLAAAQAELSQRDSIDDGGYAALSEQYNAAYAEWETAYNAAVKGVDSNTDTGMSSTELANLDISDNLAELAALTPEELLQKGKEGIKADMDGVIASVEVQGTNSATQGTALFSIASTENVRVNIEVSPDDYAKMKVGNTASITVGDYKYEGTISNVNKIAVNNAKGNPVITVQIHINNPDENICIGSTAKVSMTVAQSDNVLVVPTETINASTDGDFVFVIENGIVKKKSVELGTASTTQVEIVSGLKASDKVVDELNTDITEGMKATAIETDSEKDSEK